MLPENGGRTMDAICEMFNRFGFVFLHYVWGIRQLIPVYKNRSRAVGAIGALNQPKIFCGGDKFMYWWTVEIKYWCYQSSAEFAWTTNWHFLYQWCPPVTKPLDLPSYPLYNQLLVLSGSWSYPSPTQEQFFQLHRTWNIASTISPFLIPLLHYYGEQRSVRADIYNLTKGLLSLRVGMSHPELKFIVSKIDSVFKIVWISQIHV